MIAEFQVSNSTFQTTTHSPEQTRTLGKKIGERIEPGTVLALFGDLGSGKTVLVQGLSRGFDVPEDYFITSPTYTLINEYPGRGPLFHVDLYRIERQGDVEDIGFLDILYGNGIVVVEWADRLPSDLLSAHLEMRLEILDDESRRISLTAYGQREENLLKRLKEIYDRCQNTG